MIVGSSSAALNRCLKAYVLSRSRAGELAIRDGLQVQVISSQSAKSTALAPPKITLAALGGAAAALALQRLRRKWLALPYAWRRSATRTELMRWILFDAAPEWATTERMHALRRAVACPAQSVSYANADPLLIVGGQGARLVDVRGRRFLDTRNNVAHVGHAHPRVARRRRRGDDGALHEYALFAPESRRAVQETTRDDARPSTGATSSS